MSSALLSKLYYGDHSDVSGMYSGAGRLYRAAKKYRPEISRERVRRFLRRQPNWQRRVDRPRLARIPKGKAARHIDVSAPHMYGVVDSMSMSRFGAGLFKWCIVLIDAFSKRLNVSGDVNIIGA